MSYCRIVPWNVLIPTVFGIVIGMVSSCKLSKKQGASVKENSVLQSQQKLPVEFRGTFKITGQNPGETESKSSTMRFTLSFDFSDPKTATFIAEPTQENGLLKPQTKLVTLNRKTVRGPGLFFRLPNISDPDNERRLAVNFDQYPFEKISSMMFGGLKATEISHNDAVNDAKKTDFFNKTPSTQPSSSDALKIETGLFLSREDQSAGKVTPAVVYFDEKNKNGKIIVNGNEIALSSVTANPLNGDEPRCICTLLADFKEQNAVRTVVEVSKEYGEESKKLEWRANITVFNGLLLD